MAEIMLAGGEPLLHPDLIKIMNLTREKFPDTTVILITNGILLEKQSDIFWECCGKNNILIRITHYPVKLNIDRLKILGGKYNVSVEYWDTTRTTIKSMWKFPFDLQGKQTLKNSWYYCNQANYCIKLKEGEIHTCSVTACVCHFNKYFNTRMELSPKDYIELDKVNSIDEIYDFLCTPKPFCRYCKRKDVEIGLKWGVSKKDIYEWT